MKQHHAAVAKLVRAGITARADLMARTGLTQVQVGDALRQLRDSGKLPKHRAPVYPDRCLLAEMWK